MPFSSTVVQNSQTFAAMLKRALKTPEDEKYYLKELAKLAKQQLFPGLNKLR